MSSPNREDLEKLEHKYQVMFALFCAKQVIEYVKAEDRDMCNKVLETIEGYLEGTITKKECVNAANAAANTYTSAAANASAYAAAVVNAAYASAYAAANAAAYAAITANVNKEFIIKEQRDYYNKLLHFESCK